MLAAGSAWLTLQAEDCRGGLRRLGMAVPEANGSGGDLLATRELMSGSAGPEGSAAHAERLS